MDLINDLRIGYYALKRFKQHHGYLPNLLAPKTFNEKLLRRKIFDRNPRFAPMADKVLVKEFVSKTIGSQYVIPTLWSGKSLPPAEERTWPLPFVIKANHGCGWNHFVLTEKDLDWPAIEKVLDDWMSQTYGVYDGEWLYGKIDPQILIEPYISTLDSLPRDYKCWVFNGKMAFIEVIAQRTGGYHEAYFDKDWNEIDIIWESTPGNYEYPRPESFDKIVEFAETLSAGFDFVRADFYEIDGKPLFGELTFLPGSGAYKLDTKDMDLFIGSFWR